MIDGSECIIRLGLPGCGKTAAQTLEDVLPLLIAGEDVYCNYWLNWNGDNLHYWPPTYEGWQQIQDKTNCAIVFDEIGQVRDARQHASEGDDWRAFWQLHRHRHQAIIGNTQDVSLVAKSAGIVVEHWQYIVRDKPNPFVLFFNWLFRMKKLITFKRYILSWQRLKKMAATYELGEDDEADDLEFHTVSFSEFDLFRPDLDDFKIELIHSYCPKCAQRQGEQILKDDTDKIAYYDHDLKSWQWLATAPKCQRHGVDLALRPTAIYDTDYLPPVEVPDVVVKYFRPSPAGYRLIPYNGPVSPEKISSAKGSLDYGSD